MWEVDNTNVYSSPWGGLGELGNLRQALWNKRLIAKAVGRFHPKVESDQISWPLFSFPWRLGAGKEVSKMEQKKFTVYVDDNFRYMDEEARRKYGEYESFEEAVSVCKGIVGICLIDLYQEGMTGDELYSQYVHFGDDPWIASADPLKYQFSAWDYAKERSAEIAKQ